MPTSDHTKQLLSLALSSGDVYYRRTMETLLNGIAYDHECRTLARDYLQRLEQLRRHLSLLAEDAAVRDLRKSTDAYIELVSKDLDLQMSAGKQFSRR